MRNGQAASREVGDTQDTPSHARKSLVVDAAWDPSLGFQLRNGQEPARLPARYPSVETQKGTM